MKPGLKSLLFLIAALFGTAEQGFSLHTDPTRIEVGDTGNIAIPLESAGGGVSLIENVRVVVAAAPEWVTINEDVSYMGPVDVYPNCGRMGSGLEI